MKLGASPPLKPTVALYDELERVTLAGCYLVEFKAYVVLNDPQDRFLARFFPRGGATMWTGESLRLTTFEALAHVLSAADAAGRLARPRVTVAG